jgi:hypothetical protein
MNEAEITEVVEAKVVEAEVATPPHIVSIAAEGGHGKRSAITAENVAARPAEPDPEPEPSAQRQLVPWAALMPQNFSEAREFADMLAKSSLVPPAYRGKAGDIMVAIQWGAEIGLRPLQSLNSVAIINGRPGIFGDAAIALVWASKLCLFYDDCAEGDPDNPMSWVGVSKSWRHGTPAPIERRFSTTDARRALLWGKKGPWQEYPRRMLILRARGFLLRDLYPDVLRGTTTVEELRDIPLNQLHTPRYPVELLEERFNQTHGLQQTDASPKSLTNSPVQRTQATTESISTSRPPPLKLGG